jgi:hypothetical protein
MKRKFQILLTLAFGFTAFQAEAQCLTDDFGQYPGPYFPTVCDGVSENIIALDCWTSEYSLVGLLAGTSYTFSSSIASDLVTISDEAGSVAVAFGFTSVSYTPTTTGYYRFYLHNSEACDGDQENRSRIIVCNGDLINGCIGGNLYPTATFIPAVCDGETENIIANNCASGQYSNVSLIGSTLYAFASSIETDFITITDANGESILTFGMEFVFYQPTENEIVRFYTHTDFSCGVDALERQRIIYCLGSTTGLAGPCTIGDLWPEEPFVPACNGTPEVIAGDCWAGEYSIVILQANTAYTFTSSNVEDWITLTNSDGSSEIDFGFGPITYTTGFQAETIRFYSHTDSLCGAEEADRERRVQCLASSNSISENAANDFKLYPNPAAEKVVIAGSVKFEQIEIVSIDGRTLISISPAELTTEIDLSNLSTGVYFVRVKSEGSFVVKEFVKV